VSANDDESLKAMRLDVSRRLAERLTSAGYEAKVVQGKFIIDEPDMDSYSDWDVNDFNDENDMTAAMFTPLHYWVETNGLIVDKASSQF
jgi:hypothetical protein